MGIFSDKCEKCGQRVKKRARFCGKCGEGAPGAWIKCFKCHQWMGVESEFCPHCKAVQHRDEREMIENGVIPLKPGVFVQRIDVDAVRSRLDKSQTITIEHGTSAILMVEGEIKDVLGPGSYKAADSIWKRFFVGQPPTSLFIVDSGEIAFPYANQKLRSKEDMELNLYAEIVVQFDPRHAANMIANIIKNKRQVQHDPKFDASDASVSAVIENAVTAPPLDTNLANDFLQLGYSDFWQYFKSVFHNSIKKLCSSTSIDVLIRDPEVRFRFEQEMAKEFERVGTSCGMRLVRVSAVDFYGPDYEKLRQQAGEIEAETRRLTLENRARQVLLEDQKNKLTDEQSLKLYIDRLAFEYGVESETQANDLEALRLDLAHKLKLKSLKQEQELVSDDAEFARREAALENMFNINESIKYNDFTRSEDAKQVDHDLVQDAKRHDAEMSKVMDWMQIKDLKGEQKLKREREMLAAYAKYSDAELVAVLPPEQVELVLKIRKQENAARLEDKLSGLSPEQILAMKAAESPEAAKALAELAKAKNSSEAEVAKAKAEMAKEANAQMERVLDKSLDANAKAASNQQTFVKNN
ncbi:MAG: hypothetical protein WC082_06460 [Victivallales bacterium]